MPEEFKKEPTLIEKKTFNPKDHMTDEQIKRMEEAKDEPGATLSLETTTELPPSV
jgi:hypothetical protein